MNSMNLLAFSMPSLPQIIIVGILLAVLMIFGGLAMFAKFFVKVEQGSALIKTGRGGSAVSFSGMMVIPIMHRQEFMDISVKRIEIFFVRVNNAAADVLQVAQSIGCRRASDIQSLVELFDSKFSEALKTVGKSFDFTELYTEREKFKNEILAHLGTDLNGYVLDDAAIDYLEQTELAKLDPNNILDAEGIKKITDLTAREAVLANDIAREKQKTIKKQDVEAREAILELERQPASAPKKSWASPKKTSCVRSSWPRRPKKRPTPSRPSVSPASAASKPPNASASSSWPTSPRKKPSKKNASRSKTSSASVWSSSGPWSKNRKKSKTPKRS